MESQWQVESGWHPQACSQTKRTRSMSSWVIKLSWLSSMNPTLGKRAVPPNVSRHVYSTDTIQARVVKVSNCIPICPRHHCQPVVRGRTPSLTSPSRDGKTSSIMKCSTKYISSQLYSSQNASMPSDAFSASTNDSARRARSALEMTSTSSNETACSRKGTASCICTRRQAKSNHVSVIGVANVGYRMQQC